MLYVNCLLVLSLLTYVSNSADVSTFVARLRSPETPEEYYMSDENSFNNGETITFGSYSDTMYFAARFEAVSTGQTFYIEVSGDSSGITKKSSVKTIGKPYSYYRYYYGTWMSKFKNDRSVTATVSVFESNGDLIDSKSITIILNVVSPIVSSVVIRRSPPSSSDDFDSSSSGVVSTTYNNLFINTDNIYISCVFDNMYYGYSTNIDVKSSSGISSDSGEEVIIGNYNRYWRYYEKRRIDTLGYSGSIDGTCTVYDSNGQKVASNDFSFSYSIDAIDPEGHGYYVSDQECEPNVSPSDTKYESERVRCLNYRYVFDDCQSNQCKGEIGMIA